MEQNIEEWAKEFVAAYYASVVYSMREVYMFYDPENAVIYRESFSNKLGLKITDPTAKNALVPRLKDANKFIVTKFNTVPCKNGFNLSVFGQTIVEDSTSHFAQFFTLEFVNDRLVIIADSFQSICKEPTEELVEVERKPLARKPKSPHQTQQQPHQTQQQQQSPQQAQQQQQPQQQQAQPQQQEKPKPQSPQQQQQQQQQPPQSPGLNPAAIQQKQSPPIQQQSQTQQTENAFAKSQRQTKRAKPTVDKFVYYPK